MPSMTVQKSGKVLVLTMPRNTPVSVLNCFVFFFIIVYGSREKEIRRKVKIIHFLQRKFYVYIIPKHQQRRITNKYYEKPQVSKKPPGETALHGTQDLSNPL